MMDTGTVDSWVGRNVVLYPSDTYVRHATVIGVDSHGWEFEILDSGLPSREATRPGYRVGDRLYVSHSMRLTLAEIADE